MKKYKVGIIGATGMVGQRFVTLVAKHPWFELGVLAASPRSAGKAYRDAAHWQLKEPMPEQAADMVVLDATADIDKIVSSVDFVFSAVNMPKQDIYDLELEYAKHECPVVSNNSAHRHDPDVPMVVAMVNPEHISVVEQFRKRLGLKRGLIAVKSNCSIQSYVPALHPLLCYRPTKVLACTYQAISGAGKTFETWPEMIDNVIPYIGGEEEKSELEPLKVWGKVGENGIINAEAPSITTQCIRVPVSDGHLAAVFVSFEQKPSIEEIKAKWESYRARPQALGLPSAPQKFIHYFEEPDRPQTRLDRELEGGMAVSVGRLREDKHYDYKFVSLSHNTLLGAAGGAVQLAELLCAEGYID